MKNVIDILTIGIALLPIGIKVFGLIASATHNQRIIMLSERANIIVTALDQSNLTNDEKKKAALEKLSNYSTEVGVKVTVDQLDDYIESAVKFLKVLTA